MDGSGGHHLALPYHPTRRLHVLFSRANDRQPHPEHDPPLDQIWDRLTQSNPTLFNARKFRLHALSHAPTYSNLHLGLTDYKTFQATHMPPHPVARLGRQHMALPLGNVIVVATRDESTLLLVRNRAVGEGKGALVFPGGHPEPDAMHPPPREGENARVLDELFQGARREVLEELFLDDQHLSSVQEMRVLGIVERKGDAKPSMVFFARTALTAGEVCATYQRGNVRQEETNAIIAKPLGFLRELAAGARLHGADPMPETVGAAQLWAQMRDWPSDTTQPAQQHATNAACC